MEIVINHLTRMQRGFICVAGIDPLTMSHIRPVWPAGRLTDDLLARHGGPFDMCAVVDIGKPKRVGHAPELEDCQLDWIYLRRIRREDGKAFLAMLEAIAQTDLTAVFGPELTKRGTKAAMEPNCGKASLGCVMCRDAPSLRVVPRPPKPDQVRIWLRDPSLGELDVPVTDIRLYGPDHVTPDRKVIAKTEGRLRSRTKVILAVGVGRLPPPQPGSPPAHWLQVNNLHFADDPVWQLG
jgi:hypothetical protein